MLINWDNLGISGESNFLQLFFDPHSETLLAHFYKGIGNGYGLRSLWARRVSEDTYTRISPHGEFLSFEDPVLCPSSPHVFANVMRVDKKNGGFDGYELYCTAAYQKRGEGAVSPTEYYLSRFIIGEGRLERITRLSATFL